MKLVMTLLVRDEEDIIRDNIDFHLSQGVDFIIATDNASVDATPAILEEYQRRGVLELLHEPRDDYSQHEWVTRMARIAASHHEADWVINNDADEFWWPTVGNLKSQLSEVSSEAAAIQAQRFNFLQREDCCDALAFYERLTLRDTRSVNASGHPLPTKTCHRASDRIDVAQGNHSVSIEGRVISAPLHEGILIFHFPVRTYSQFSNKIRLGGAAYERNKVLHKSVGATWRHLYSEFLAGRLHDAYVNQSVVKAVDYAHSERFVADDRLREHLRTIKRL